MGKTESRSTSLLTPLYIYCANRSRRSFFKTQSRFQPPAQRSLHNAQRGGTPRASPAPSDSATNRMGGAPRVTPPPAHAGKRPPRPSSGAEKFHRREPSGGDRRPQTARTPTSAPGRKLQAKDAYPEPGMRSPDKVGLPNWNVVPVRCSGYRPGCQLAKWAFLEWPFFSNQLTKYAIY